MREKILKYSLMQPYFMFPKENYESILCELINKTCLCSRFDEKFFLCTSQSNGEDDVYTESKRYSLDFKMMIAQNMAQFLNETKNEYVKIGNAIVSYGKNSSPREVISLYPACKNINKEKLENLKTQSDKIAKYIKHFFYTVLSKNKNILIFLPSYFIINTSSSTDEYEIEVLLQQMFLNLKYIKEFRDEYAKNKDTFFVFVIKNEINKSKFFILSEFMDNKLNFIGKVNFYELESVNRCKPDFY